ncbi:MAG: DUF1330 domain-containing protein [Pseudomonadota bacterium]|nr:DUF1330 domain-containing protein [Pseudomonadota bacterium]
MAAYIVAQITIHDRETYGKYEAGFMDIFSAHGGKLLAVEESPTVLEGDWSCTRTIIAEFPDQDTARGWYHCDEYQALMKHRTAASVGSIALLNGLPV